MKVPILRASVAVLAVPALAISFQSVQIPRDSDEVKPYRQLLSNYEDLQYYGTLIIGNQSVNCVLDTGSVEFVVISDKCHHWCGPEEKLFHSNASKSYIAGSEDQVLSYGSGQLTGTLAYEQVSVGHIHVEKTSFWEIVDASMPLLWESDFQAIVGMGPVDPKSSTSVLVAEQGESGKTMEQRSALLPRALHVERFGICLGRDLGSTGYFTWNDASIFDAQLNMMRLHVPATGYWMVKLRDVRIGSTVFACKEGCGAVIDSGTSLLAMPDGAQAHLESAASRLHRDCHDLHELPDIRFTLGEGTGQMYSLPADAYIGEVVGEASEHTARHFKAKKKSQCEVAVMSITMDSMLGNVWILGVPFLRKYYTVFAQATPQSNPAIYTAVADDDCRPTQAGGFKQSLVGGGLRPHRRVNASALRIPSWAWRGSDNGRLEQNLIIGRELVNSSAPLHLHH